MSKDYLQEGYGGEPQNPLTDKCFFCYTIHDTEFNKYYSGVKTRENSGEHGLLETYFTSSTVVDFKSRLKDTPEVFGVRIEYFTNRSDAFDAEKRFHAAHDVGKNKAFYNACAAGGSNCGAGSVLCIKDDGSTYRVSTEKYRKGEDRSVSARQTYCPAFHKYSPDSVYFLASSIGGFSTNLSKTKKSVPRTVSCFLPFLICPRPGCG